MKNTLLVVLIIALCYDHTQAQINSSQSPGYIKYQGKYSNQSVEKRTVTTSVITDGIAATDKLAYDISTVYTMTDGVTTTDKLADDIVHSLETFTGTITVDSPALTGTPAALLQQDESVSQPAYIGYMMYQLQKPRPINSKRTGRLQL
jgi:hypothetical protein